MVRIPLLEVNLTQAPEPNFELVIKKDAARSDIPTFEGTVKFTFTNLI